MPIIKPSFEIYWQKGSNIGYSDRASWRQAYVLGGSTLSYWSDSRWLDPLLLNSRMALSAHLAAVQSGMALMIFGVIWKLLSLNEKWLKVTYWSGLLSMYLVWASITVSAIFGASKALPMAGHGFSASYVVEMIVLVTVYSGAGLGILASLIIVCGLSKYAQSKVI